MTLGAEPSLQTPDRAHPAPHAPGQGAADEPSAGDPSAAARCAIRALLDGGAVPASSAGFGRWSGAIAALAAAAAGGRSEVLPVFDDLALADPSLAHLVAGPLPLDDGPADPARAKLARPPSPDDRAAHDPRFRLLPADALDALPPLHYLDPHDELPAGGLVVLYGAPEAGKSFLALDMAARIAQSQGVVYVAGEGLRGLAVRKLAWCTYNRCGAGRLYFLDRAVQLLVPAEVSGLLELAAPLRPALFVIDTLARCMAGGDENNTRDMSAFVAGCDALREATGACVLVLHHTTKQGAAERGSSVLRGAADQMIALAARDAILTLQCDKVKDAARPPARALRRLVVPTGRMVAGGRPETSCVVVPCAASPAGDALAPRGDALSPAARRILAFLAGPQGAAGATAARLAGEAHLPPSTAYKLIAQLRQRGWVVQDGPRRPIALAPAGAELLARAGGQDGLGGPRAADAHLPSLSSTP